MSWFRDGARRRWHSRTGRAGNSPPTRWNRAARRCCWWATTEGCWRLTTGSKRAHRGDKENDTKQAAAGRAIDCMKSFEVSVWDFVACRHSLLPPLRHTRLPDGMPEAMLLLFGGHDPARKVEHDDWWLYTHAHDLLETPARLQGHG